MKIDYDFLKKILIIMEEDQRHRISNLDISRQLKLDLNNSMDFDKFLGHLLLLADNMCIDSEAVNLGFLCGANDIGLYQK